MAEQQRYAAVRRTQQQAAQPSGRSKKRPAPASVGVAAEGGEIRPEGAEQEDEEDYTCPICLHVIEEAYMTKCGHSFCHRCLTQRLDQSSKCPICTRDTQGAVYPNHMLNSLALRHRERSRVRAEAAAVAECARAAAAGALDAERVSALIAALQEQRRRLERDDSSLRSMLLLEFLVEMKRKKQQRFDRVSAQLGVVVQDLAAVERSLAAAEPAAAAPGGDDAVVPAASSGSCDAPEAKRIAFGAVGFASLLSSAYSTMAARRMKLSQHADDLEQCYFACRLPGGDGERRPTTGTASAAESGEGSLDGFVDCLEKFTRYTSFRTLATINYSTDSQAGGAAAGPSIVSSIEFDKDADYFAVAGVSKRIKVFEYGSMITDAYSVHYPVAEMACSSKVSCVSWNYFHKSMLASADYEGIVTLWDAFATRRTRVYQEHERRCWCVDFNRIDTSLMASGSDDFSVRIWSTNVAHSVASVDGRVNVCCVQFNPTSAMHFAFGATDHCVHYYDLRNLKRPLAVMRGHRKAVSFIRFLNGSEIVSAAVDSQLRLWDVSKTTGLEGDDVGGDHSRQPSCVRVLQGHVNERSFVGLATDGDYVACGSEDNTLCVYYKGLSKDLMRHRFDGSKSDKSVDRDAASVNANPAGVASAAGSGTVQAAGTDDESATGAATIGGVGGETFVSAVAWKPATNVVVAGNSHGLVKVIELV